MIGAVADPARGRSRPARPDHLSSTTSSAPGGARRVRPQPARPRGDRRDPAARPAPTAWWRCSPPPTSTACVQPFPVPPLDGAELADEPHPVLPHAEVRYDGQPVAAVIAETRALAEDAAELVRGRVRAAAGGRQRPRLRPGADALVAPGGDVEARLRRRRPRRARAATRCRAWSPRRSRPAGAIAEYDAGPRPAHGVVLGPGPPPPARPARPHPQATRRRDPRDRPRRRRRVRQQGRDRARGGGGGRRGDRRSAGR